MARLGRAQPNRPVVLRSTLEDAIRPTEPVVCSIPGIRHGRGRVFTSRTPLGDAPAPPPPTPGLLTGSVAGSSIASAIAASNLTPTVAGSNLTVTTSP